MTYADLFLVSLACNLLDLDCHHIDGAACNEMLWKHMEECKEVTSR